MERTSLAFAVSFLGNWRAGSGREAGGGGLLGITRGRGRGSRPRPRPLSFPFSLPDCKFIVAWPRVFCSLIPQRACQRERDRQPREVTYRESRQA